MGVVPETSCQATESFVLPSPRTLYPAQISVPHWQLRHFISSPAPNTLFYAAGAQVCCLDTTTRKREVVAVLPFQPRCFAACHGWICAGGDDNGEFAAIKLDDDHDNGPEEHQRHVDVDGLLPLDLDPESRRHVHRSFSQSMPSSWDGARQRPEVQVQELGGLIVNSVTIYQWNKDSDDLPDDTVAVVTNNDKTVRIFSLTSFKTLHTLEFPKAMNHATISPDGTLLVSVGDEERVYFHKLIRSKHADSILDSGQFEWKSCAKFKLTAVDDHCFSTAFSPSGRLCAVGSQDGIVTIFETELIASAQEDNDAVMRIMRSSRQGIMDGAVRSMCFSPEPWDLLIWAEDRGRICVADIRPASQWRQVVNINPKADDVDRAVVTDLADSLIDPELRELNSQADFIRRYHGELDAQDGDAAISFVTELIQASSERRRLQRQARSQDEEIGALTERERQLLDALRISRERMNARERRESQDRNSPFSISYLRPPSAGHDSGTTSSLLAADDYLALPSANSGSRDSTSGASSRRDYSRDHNNDRPRTGDHPYEPRRRRSVILSHSLTEPSSTAAADNSGSPRGQTEDTATAADPWRTIEAAMASGPLPNAASRLRREREAAIEASFERRQQNWTRMDVARREGLRNIYSRTPDADGEGLERYGAANLLRRAGRTHDGPGEVGTAGLALSEDGRTLYVGTQLGILEFKINIQERKFIPRICPR